jgi:hypothetical protein
MDAGDRRQETGDRRQETGQKKPPASGAGGFSIQYRLNVRFMDAIRFFGTN